MCIILAFNKDDCVGNTKERKNYAKFIQWRFLNFGIFVLSRQQSYFC